MNSENIKERSILPSLLAIVGALLIVLILIWAMRQYMQPSPLNQNRAAERAKALAELRGQEHQELTTAGWIDQGKGLVRLPIEEAMKLVEREWHNPGAARSNLIARVEKANPPPPPPPANPFE
jgi:hypothetical protein